MGDEIMALFGAPTAHENDPSVRAALEMRRTLAEFNEEQRAPLAIHFGVNTGLVYAGDVVVVAGITQSWATPSASPPV